MNEYSWIQNWKPPVAASVSIQAGTRAQVCGHCKCQAVLFPQTPRMFCCKLKPHIASYSVRDHSCGPLFLLSLQGGDCSMCWMWLDGTCQSLWSRKSKRKHLRPFLGRSSWEPVLGQLPCWRRWSTQPSTVGLYGAARHSKRAEEGVWEVSIVGNTLCKCSLLFSWPLRFGSSFVIFSFGPSPSPFYDCLCLSRTVPDPLAPFSLPQTLRASLAGCVLASLTVCT